MSEKLHPTAQIVVELGHLQRLKRERSLNDEEVAVRRIRIGQAVRELRELRGMALRQLARQLDVAPSFLSDFETGKRWSDPMVDRIRHILFTPPEGET